MTDKPDWKRWQLAIAASFAGIILTAPIVCIICSPTGARHIEVGVVPMALSSHQDNDLSAIRLVLAKKLHVGMPMRDANMTLTHGGEFSAHSGTIDASWAQTSYVMSGRPDIRLS